MSQIEVDKVIPQSGTALQVGEAGDTVNIVGTLQNNGAELTGDISSVVAGTGLAGGGTTGDVTLNIEAAQPTVTSTGTLTSFRSTGIDDNSNALAMTINSSEQVGIGTASPSSLLHLDTNTEDANSPFINFDNNDGNIGQIRMSGSGDFGFRANTGGTGNMFFQTGGGSERMRIESDGAVLVGTTTDGDAGAGDLVVNGGVFLGGSAAANKLDDYEEGTWTPAITGATGVTNLVGTYTKVGRLVTVFVEIINGNIGGSPSYEITGLPFTVGSVRSTTSSVASNYGFASNAGSVYGLLSQSATKIEFLYNRDNTSWTTQSLRTFSNTYLSFSASYNVN